MKSRTGFFAIVLIWLGACATQHYQNVDAVRVTHSNNSDGDIKGIIEDATQIDRRFSLLPSAKESKWDGISKLNIPFDQKLTKIKNLYCDGSKPRFIPTIKIQVIPPKAPPDIAVDKFATARREFVQTARNYLVLHFLADASEPNPEVDGNDGFNSDFVDFKKYIMNAGGERKYAQVRFTQFVPSAVGNFKETKAYYQNTGYLPASPKDEVDSYTWHNIAKKNLLILMDPKSGSALLVPKIAPVLTAKWNDQSLTTTVENLYFGEMDASNSTAYHNLSLKTFYGLSDDGWKLGNGQVLYPLHLASIGDLEALRRYFTFLIPESIQRKQFGKVRAFYGFKDDKISAEQSIRHADQIWQRILKAQVVEAPTEDGSVAFDLNWEGVSLFCEYGQFIVGLSAK